MVKDRFHNRKNRCRYKKCGLKVRSSNSYTIGLVRLQASSYMTGPQVWLPPDVNDQFRRSLHLHDRLIVEGHGTENEYGRALESLAIRIPGAPLTPLDHGTDGLEPPPNAPLGR
jgi:hypothetical protein